MYIFKNAFVSIKRNKGRNILIGIIILVISIACAVTLSINNSAEKIVKSYEEKYNIEASLAMNRESLMKNLRGEDEKKSQEELIESFNKIESITLDEIKNYGESDYVSNYYYVYNTNVNIKDVTEATDTLMKETTKVETTTRKQSFGQPPGNMHFPGGGNFGSKTTTTKKTTTTEKIYNNKAQGGAFTLLGYSSYESMRDFIDGKYIITDGEVNSDFESNSCVISEELATLNDLKVGDTITIVSPNDEKVTYELVISGIYKENSDISEDMSVMFSSSANTVITNHTVIEKLKEQDEKFTATITPTYILKNKEVVELFEKEVKEKGLSEYYTITNNLETITSATKSIVNVKKFAITFLLITLAIGGVVLFVINMINIRERKYEIGVLRTIGMKKSTLITQFMIELIIVCVIGLSLGAFIGSKLSVNVANNLLQNEINNSKVEYQNVNKNFGGRDIDFNKIGIANIEQIDKIDAIVDIKVLFELLGIGLLLTIISGISSLIAIARFQPLQILKERS